MSLIDEIPKEDQRLMIGLDDYRVNRSKEIKVLIRQLKDELSDLNKNLTRKKIAEKFDTSESLVNRIINRGEI